MQAQQVHISKVSFKVLSFLQFYLFLHVWSYCWEITTGLLLHKKLYDIGCSVAWLPINV
jgi:hypothetical protein